jgi:hypothetical protein
MLAGDNDACLRNWIRGYGKPCGREEIFSVEKIFIHQMQDSVENSPAQA